MKTDLIAYKITRETTFDITIFSVEFSIERSGIVEIGIRTIYIYKCKRQRKR